MFTAEPGHSLVAFSGSLISSIELTLRVRVRAPSTAAVHTVKAAMAAMTGPSWHIDAPAGVGQFSSITASPHVRTITVIAGPVGAPTWQCNSTGIDLAVLGDNNLNDSSLENGYAVEVADMNGDGRLDILSGRPTMFPFFVPYLGFNIRPAPQLHLGGVTESWTAAQGGTGFGDVTSGLGLGDFGGDGDFDFVSCALHAGCTVQLNDGVGGFTTLSTSIVYPPHTQGAVTVGDIDGDGRDDVVTSGTLVAAWRSLGNGAFAPSSLGLPATSAAGGPFGDVVLFDVDLDSDLDIVVITTGAIQTYLNDGSGAWTSGATLSFPGPLVCRRFTLADFDGDADVDIVAVIGMVGGGAPRRGALTMWRRNAGTWSIDLAAGLPTALSYREAAPIDLDGDGLMDLIAAHHDLALPHRAGHLQVWRNTGGGVFARDPSLEFGLSNAGLGTVHRMRVRDVNGDGLEDILVNADGRVAVYSRVGHAHTRVFGNVGAAGSGGPQAILSVSGGIGTVGSTGDVATHAVAVGLSQPITVHLMQVPTSPAPSRFILFGALGAPTQTSGLETTIGAFSHIPAIFSPLNPTLFTLANAYDPYDAGALILGALPGSWHFTHAAGLPTPATFSLYGIIDDPSALPFGLAVTNTVVVDVH